MKNKGSRIFLIVGIFFSVKILGLYNMDILYAEENDDITEVDDRKIEPLYPLNPKIVVTPLVPSNSSHKDIKEQKPEYLYLIPDGKEPVLYTEKNLIIPKKRNKKLKSSVHDHEGNHFFDRYSVTLTTNNNDDDSFDNDNLESSYINELYTALVGSMLFGELD